MKTNKQKAIRGAYVKLIGEEKFEQIKNDVDENGWVYTQKIHFNSSLNIGYSQIEATTFDSEMEFYWRPISLKNIETNNNWISILSESDLPTEDCDCHIEFEDGAISIDRYFVFGKNFTSNHWRFIVAYRLIEKPNKRFY